MCFLQASRSCAVPGWQREPMLQLQAFHTSVMLCRVVSTLSAFASMSQTVFECGRGCRQAL